MRTSTLTAALGAAAIALGVLPATGSAKTFCVSKPSCVGTIAATVPAAASMSGNSAGFDRIEIGEGTFPSASMYFPGVDSVEVVGAGRGKTILQSDGTAGVALSQAGSSVSDLTVQIGEQSVVGIDLGGANTKAERVEVIGSAVETSASDSGIILRHGGTVRDAVITMPMHPQYADYGISVSPNTFGDPANGPTLIEDVTITSGYAVYVQASNRAVTIRRGTLKGGTFGVGMATPVPEINLEDVSASGFHDGTPNRSANGLNIYGFDSASSPTVVNLRHVTASATHAGGRALSVQQQGVAPLTINAVDSAFFGGLGSGIDTGSFDIELAGFKTGTQMHATRSAWRSTNLWVPSEQVVVGPSASHLFDDGGNIELAGHPGQQVVDLVGGDLRPIGGSVLIDNGTPGPLEPAVGVLDAAGAQRLVDGDSDGDVRRDIGAFEAPVATSAGHTAPAAMGTLCQVTTICGKTGGGGPPKVLPRTTVLKLMPKKSRKEISGTTTGAVSSVLVSITRKKGKKCQALSAKQTWIKTVKLAGGKGCAPSYVLAAKGTASWKLKLKKELPKGKYVVTVRASGADGMESAPKARAFKR